MPKVITITGTNGKGSTARVLESLLLEAGKTVGLLVTPSIRFDWDMFHLDGVPQTKEQVELARHGNVVPWNDHITSVFTATTLFWNCDYIILESFMGGKDDATNLIDADVVIITNIADDHIPELGANFEEVALNKAQLLREGSVGVIGIEAPQQSIRDYAYSVGANLVVEGVDFDTIEVESRIHRSNISLAVEACMALGVKPNLDRALENIRGTGYFDTYNWNGTTVVTDACHNEHAMRFFVDQVKSRVKPSKEVYTICPLPKGHESSHSGMIDILNEITTQWLSPVTNPERLLSPVEMANLVDTEQFDSLEDCFGYLKEVKKNGDVIVVCGNPPITYEVKSILDDDILAH